MQLKMQLTNLKNIIKTDTFSVFMAIKIHGNPTIAKMLIEAGTDMSNQYHSYLLSGYRDQDMIETVMKAYNNQQL